MNWSVGDMVLLRCQCGQHFNNSPANGSLALVAEEALLLEEAGRSLLGDCGVSMSYSSLQHVPELVLTLDLATREAKRKTNKQSPIVTARLATALQRSWSDLRLGRCLSVVRTHRWWSHGTRWSWTTWLAVFGVMRMWRADDSKAVACLYPTLFVLADAAKFT